MICDGSKVCQQPSEVGQVGHHLRALAARLARQVSDRRDPHRFHEEKGDMVAELKRLADALAA